MDKEELKKEICKRLLDKYFYIDFQPIKTLLDELQDDTLGDILADLKY